MVMLRAGRAHHESTPLQQPWARFPGAGQPLPSLPSPAQPWLVGLPVAGWHTQEAGPQGPESAVRTCHPWLGGWQAVTMAAWRDTQACCRPSSAPHGHPATGPSQPGPSPHLSPWRISCRFRPSKDTHAVFLASGDSMI